MRELTTYQQLVNFFDDFSKPTKAKIVTRTLVRLNKRDTATKTITNNLGLIFKVQTIEVELNSNYEAKVNNNRFLEGKEQSFEAEDLKWGEHINGSIVEHNGQWYLKTIVLSKIAISYERQDGSMIEYDQFEQFVPPYKGSVKQETEAEVKVRSFKLENVIGVHIHDVMRFVA